MLKVNNTEGEGGGAMSQGFRASRGPGFTTVGNSSPKDPMPASVATAHTRYTEIHLDKNDTHNWAVVAHTFNPSTWGQRQADLCEFKASLVYNS